MVSINESYRGYQYNETREQKQQKYFDGIFGTVNAI
jgi:hypothetical protein